MDKNLPGLTFSYNWNNKLNCQAFTTIRIENPNKYFVAGSYNVFLKGNYLKAATIVVIKTLQLEAINDSIAFIDTGYNADECKKIIFKMYPKIDFQKKRLYFIVLKSIA